jgi:transmembrane sensor
MHKLADTRDDRLERAVEWFLRVRSDEACAEDLSALRKWLESDPQNALAYQQIAATWNAMDAHASAPEIVIGRRDALEGSRIAARRRWSAKSLSFKRWAAAAGVLLALIAGSEWFIAERAGVYATEVGERRTVTLEDESLLALDARSRVRVRYTRAQRQVILEEGHAKFTVARDPLRPFRVQARDQTVVALGTQFDVELISNAVLVTLIDGQVAVVGVDSQSLSERGDEGHSEHTTAEGVRRRLRQTPSEGERVHSSSVSDRVVELQAGQELRVRGDGHAELVANVSLDRAAAWQTGKLFFENEPLADAVVRINRYARRPIVVDPSVAEVGVSGVFNAGDERAFVEAITSYFPVQVEDSRATVVRLTARK